MLITRPEAAARRFALTLKRARVIVSPLMRLAPAPPEEVSALLAEPFDALIFTSENAVHVVRDLPGLAGRTAFVPGPRTAEAAEEAGLTAVCAEGDARNLLALLLLRARDLRLLYLRGAEVARDLATPLLGAGISVREKVVYRQIEVPISAEAKAALEGTQPVIAPLFSARSAALLLPHLSARAPVRPIAISAGTAAVLPTPFREQTVVAAAKNGSAMSEAVQRQIDALVRVERPQRPR
ncbi:uroporphyrinogen-III synthase [Poseidonocella sedimentorum]|uniref:uroporphyrinogen-III synthase n=1 Tax=Poseidonocella sedimentorum TaxID=871652 RepID=UPI0015A730A4|nr:uroporphyrinogen-III synthase [Poseidonocella sedimentorum]